MRKRLLDPALLLAPILILGALAAPFIHAQFGGIMNRAKDRIDQGKQKAKPATDRAERAVENYTAWTPQEEQEIGDGLTVRVAIEKVN